MGVKSIIRMLSLNEARSFREVREIEALLSIPEGKESVMDLLMVGVAKKFMERLGKALLYGFVETPSVRVEEGAIVRGRILSSALPKALLASPTPRVVFEVQFYTTDNSVNRYILNAGYMLYIGALNLLKIASTDESVLVKAMLELDYVPSAPMGGIKVHELLLQVPFDRPYIYELVRLAAVIRKWLEHGLPPRPGGIVGVPSLYINMDRLFEGFVRKIIQIVARWLRRTRGLDITVKGAGSGKPLVVSPRPKAYLRPDILIEVGRAPVAVGDIKYKLVEDPLKSGPEGDRGAINQVYTFIHGWNVEKGFLVYPSLTGQTLYECHTLKGGKKLYIIALNVYEAPRTFRKLQTSKMFKTLCDFLVELAEVKGLENKW